MKILIINGSHRQGNTDILIEHIRTELKGKADLREVILREIDMKLPDGCEDCCNSEFCKNIHDEFSKQVEPTIRDYDVYLIATPTWDDGVTPLIKIFWDRIVAWCQDDRKYLRNKKLAIITHGMAGRSSWKYPISWVKGVCAWEESYFAGSLAFKSDAQVGTIEINQTKLKAFIRLLLKK